MCSFVLEHWSHIKIKGMHLLWPKYNQNELMFYLLNTGTEISLPWLKFLLFFCVAVFLLIVFATSCGPLHTQTSGIFGFLLNSSVNYMFTASFIFGLLLLKSSSCWEVSHLFCTNKNQKDLTRFYFVGLFFSYYYLIDFCTSLEVLQLYCWLSSLKAKKKSNVLPHGAPAPSG